MKIKFVKFLFPSRLYWQKRLGSAGQALVTLLVFAAIATAVTAATVAVAIINLQATSQFSQGQQAFYTAEAGVEDAIIHLERDQSFSSPGYNIQVGGSNALVQVQPAGITLSKTVISEGINGSFKRKIQLNGSFDSNGVFLVNSWNEIDD